MKEDLFLSDLIKSANIHKLILRVSKDNDFQLFKKDKIGRTIPYIHPAFHTIDEHYPPQDIKSTIMQYYHLNENEYCMLVDLNKEAAEQVNPHIFVPHKGFVRADLFLKMLLEYQHHLLTGLCVQKSIYT